MCSWCCHCPQVWTDKTHWQGWVMCIDKGAPASYPVLLQLPANVLEAALEKLPRKHWVALLRYATSKECSVPVFAPVRAVLNKWVAAVSQSFCVA